VRFLLLFSLVFRPDCNFSRKLGCPCCRLPLVLPFASALDAASQVCEASAPFLPVLRDEALSPTSNSADSVATETEKALNEFKEQVDAEEAKKVSPLFPLPVPVLFLPPFFLQFSFFPFFFVLTFHLLTPPLPSLFPLPSPVSLPSTGHRPHHRTS
jgi:hypothetical protein